MLTDENISGKVLNRLGLFTAAIKKWINQMLYKHNRF